MRHWHLAFFTDSTPIPPTDTPTDSDFENALVYSMLDFNFIDPPSIDHNEPVYSE